MPRGEVGLEDWARRLRREWNARARSPVRDFFVGSGPGWDDPAIQERMAATGVEFLLTGLDAARLAQSRVLEVGCGTGRLAPHLRRRVRDYTGIDISAEMCAEATRTRAQDGVRFLECDGLSVPAAARDRSYDLIVALAVFIHCPKAIIGAMVASACAELAPGGEMRFQVNADVADPTGLAPGLDLAALERAAQSVELSAPAESLALITDHYYEGHRFRHDEAQAFFSEFSGAVELHRQGPLELWVVLRSA